MREYNPYSAEAREAQRVASLQAIHEDVADLVRKYRATTSNEVVAIIAREAFEDACLCHGIDNVNAEFSNLFPELTL